MNTAQSKILVIQNDATVPVGDFGSALQREGAELFTHHIYMANLDKLDTANYNGLVVLGGRVNAFDDGQAPFLADVVQLIKEFHTQQKPVFGICLGAQLLARAFGGEYRSNEGWEVAFTELSITPLGQQDPILSGFPETLSLYEMHQDTLELPLDSQLLITGKKCKNQAFKVGQFSYGVQFHPEANSAIVNRWAEAIADNLDETTLKVHQSMLNTSDKQFIEQQLICDHFALRWLEIVQQQMQSS